VVGGLLSWIASRRRVLADLDERMVEQYLRHRAGKQSIQPGDRSALKRWLSVLREEGAIAPVVLPPLTSHDRIFNEFDVYLRTERGLPRSPSFVISLSSAGSCTRCVPPVTTT
jgi:hypothetical protein